LKVGKTLHHWPTYFSVQFIHLAVTVREKTRSYATAKSTARPSCLVGVLYDISWEKICWRLINHFYLIGHKSYRIRRNKAK